MSQAPPSRRFAARFFAGVLVLAGLALNAAQAFESAATLALRLVDAGTGGVLPGCVRIAAAEGGGWLNLDLSSMSFRQLIEWLSRHLFWDTDPASINPGRHDAFLIAWFGAFAVAPLARYAAA